MPDKANNIAAIAHPYFSEPYTAEERKELMGSQLQTIRKYYRLTQKEVSEIIGVTAQTYSGYEKGKFEPSAETLVRLAYLYCTTIDYLVGKKSTPQDPDGDIEDYLDTYNPEKVKDIEERMAIIQNELEEIKKHMPKE